MTARVQSLSVADPLAEPSLQRALVDDYLVWDGFVAGERRVDLHPLLLSPALHAQAVRAAEDVARLVDGVARSAFDDDDEAARYRIHPSIARLARASHAAGDDARLVRVDLLLGADGVFRACEVNADCPGGHNEAHGLPRLARAAGHSRGHDPTRVLSALAQRLAALAEESGVPDAVGFIYATAYAEDLQVCALVRRALAKLGIDGILAPPTSPRFVDGRLCIGGRPVGALYRYFPAEYMEGQRNLADYEAAIATGAVRTLSSFAQLYAQSKLAFARACAHGARSPHLPETLDLQTIEPSRLLAERADWVVKRAFGRVGEDVLVGSLYEDGDWLPALRAALADQAKGQSWIAQRFVRQAPIATPWGPRYVTLGAYVLDGVFQGYFARITPESHVSHDALVVPVFVAEDA
jgi:glutathionylspermidine synthase